MDIRHETIGIKQAIRFEWMQKTANLVLAGMNGKAIRQELHEFLAEKLGSGSAGIRGETSRKQLVNMLMKIWFSKDPNITPFRDALLAVLRKNPSMAMAVHWGMISAVYPFWFQVSRQTGRLLAMQNQVTQAQITNRMKELYGDRQTVSRYTRYVLRSFTAWGALNDSKVKGCYENVSPICVAETKLVILMLESALLASTEGKGTLGLLLNNPAFFPFQFPVLTGDFISQHSDRIEVVRYGLDDELLNLRDA